MSTSKRPSSSKKSKTPKQSKQTLVLRGTLRRQELVRGKQREIVPPEPLSEGKTAMLYPVFVVCSLLALVITVVAIDHPIGAVIFLLYAAICFMRPDWIMKFLDVGPVGIYKSLFERSFIKRERWFKQVRDIPVELEVDTEGDAPSLSWRYLEERASEVEFEPVDVVADKSMPVQAPLTDGSIPLDDARLGFSLSRSPQDKEQALLEMRSPGAGQRLGVSFGEAWLDPDAEVPLLERPGVVLDRDDEEALLLALARMTQMSGARWPRALEGLRNELSADEFAQKKQSPVFQRVAEYARTGPNEES